ncbi:MAG: hypothetical protein V3U71_13735 [Cocleimonas sp.]
MKILFAGNSQTTCLKIAFDSNPETLDKHEVYFHVTPGATGPYFKIKDDQLSVIQGAINPNFPARLHPEGISTPPLSSFDVIIISALGYVDGGFLYQNTVMKQGVLHQFSPKKNDHTQRLLSKPCLKEIVFTLLSQQHGFQFLDELKNHFNKKIIVQPFPIISEIVKDHPDWLLNRLYNDPIGAHKFFQKTRDDYLDFACNKSNIKLLPYPVPEWKSSMFSPKDKMSLADGQHPTNEYGPMILEQIKNELDKHN